MTDPPSKRMFPPYLLIYVVGHLLSAMLIGYMLGRLRLVPVWAAWAFALTSPLTIIYFSMHIIEVRYVLRYLICALRDDSGCDRGAAGAGRPA